MDARSPEARVLHTPDEATLDLKRQIALFRRWRTLFVSVSCAVFALAAVAICLIPHRYGAVASVLIDQRRERVVELTQVLPDLPNDASVVDTEVEVLKSRTLADKVASSLVLDRDPEFNPALQMGVWRLWTSSPLHRPAPDGREAVVDRLSTHVRVARVGFTSIIAITAHSRSPQSAARIANAFADLYLQRQLDAKTLAARRASDFLRTRLGGLRTQVEAAEHEVERYKTAHGLMTLTDSQGATITEQEISNLDTQLATARGERAEAEARLSAAQGRIAGGGQGDDVGEVLNSPVVQELRKQRDDVAKQIAELQGRYGPRHPELLKAERQRTELDAQIQQEIVRVLSNLRVQAGVARSRAAAVASALTNAKASLAQSNAASVGLKELERNLESVRTLYQSFLDRFKQTSAQDGMAQSDARIVSSAKVPQTPDFPNRPLLVAMALAGSLTLGLMAIWSADMREDGLYSAEDVERRLPIPCLGLVPVARSAAAAKAAVLSPADLILSEPSSGFAEAFRALKTGVFKGRGAGPVRTVVICSALPGEGKTTTCIALGRVIARSGASVVVVDCDLRRRTINTLLAKASRIGLLDVLSDAAKLDDALVVDGGLTLLPLGDDLEAEDEILDCPAMDRMLEELRRRFRVVILDTAPVLLIAETRALAAKADAVLFLARWRKTPAEAASSAVRILSDAGAHVIGAALTQVDGRYMDRRAYPYAAIDYPFYRRDTDSGRRGFPASDPGAGPQKDIATS